MTFKAHKWQGLQYSRVWFCQSQGIPNKVISYSPNQRLLTASVLSISCSEMNPIPQVFLISPPGHLMRLNSWKEFQKGPPRKMAATLEDTWEGTVRMAWRQDHYVHPKGQQGREPQGISISTSEGSLQKGMVWTSLVAQWLRIRLPMQGTPVRALVQEDPTCCIATKPMRHDY